MWASTCQPPSGAGPAAKEPPRESTRSRRPAGRGRCRRRPRRGPTGGGAFSTRTVSAAGARAAAAPARPRPGRAAARWSGSPGPPGTRCVRRPRHAVAVALDPAGNARPARRRWADDLVDERQVRGGRPRRRRAAGRAAAGPRGPAGRPRRSTASDGAGGVRRAVDQPLPGGGLHDHDAERVPDDVVQLAGDAGPLVAHRHLGEPLASGSSSRPRSASASAVSRRRRSAVPAR